MTRSPRRPFRRAARGDAGFTLVESVVAMMLTAVFMALVTPVLQSVSNALISSNTVLATEAQGRLALESLSLQVTSAIEICLPTQFSATGFTVRTLDVVSSTGTGSTLVETYQWDQWTLAPNNGGLQEERAVPQTSTSASSVAWPHAGSKPTWTTVTHGVVNNGVAPFVLPAASAGSPQSLSVRLQIASGSGSSAATVVLNAQFAALDTPYGTGGSSCSTVSPAQ